MNKLMLAATLALSMSAMAKAACGDLPPPVAVNCALVYDFNISLKTTVAKPGKPEVIKSLCGDPEEIEAQCYRVKGSKSLKGFINSCDCWCVPVELTEMVVTTDDQSVVTTNYVGTGVYGDDYDTNLDGWSVSLWDNKAKLVYAANDPFEFDAMWAIGKKNKDLEVSWFFDGADDVEMNASGMGFGALDIKNRRMKNANGTLVAWLSAPEYVDTKNKLGYEDCLCWGYPYDICTGEYLDDKGTIGFGTWKLKYNAKASAAAASTGALPYPKWW